MKPIFDAVRRCGVPKCKIGRPLALAGFSCLAALTMAVYLGAQASAILCGGVRAAFALLAYL